MGNRLVEVWDDSGGTAADTVLVKTGEDKDALLAQRVATVIGFKLFSDSKPRCF